jgi:hypothetical protein
MDSTSPTPSTTVIPPTWPNITNTSPPNTNVSSSAVQAAVATLAIPLAFSVYLSIL